MQPGIIVAAVKSSFTTCFIGTLKYLTGGYTYMVLPHKVWLGALVICTIFFNKSLTKNCFMELALPLFNSIVTFLKNLGPSFLVYNLCVIWKKSSQYAKAAGTFCKILTLDLDRELILIQLPTMKKKWLSWNCIVFTGRVSNIFHKNEIFGKAGCTRLLNIRPTVRGVAMNPIDHPHGGRTKSNSPEMTPWGKIAKHNK